MSRESIIHSCLGRLQVTKSTTSADWGADTDAETAGGGDGKWSLWTCGRSRALCNESMRVLHFFFAFYVKMII